MAPAAASLLTKCSKINGDRNKEKNCGIIIVIVIDIQYSTNNGGNMFLLTGGVVGVYLQVS